MCFFQNLSSPPAVDGWSLVRKAARDMEERLSLVQSLLQVRTVRTTRTLTACGCGLALSVTTCGPGTQCTCMWAWSDIGMIG